MARPKPAGRAVTHFELPPDAFWQFLITTRRVIGGALTIAIAIMWAWFSWDLAREDIRFDGQPVADAVITRVDREVSGVRNPTVTLYAHYQFTLRDGRSITGDDRIPASEESELTRTHRAKVQYLPDDPARSRLFFPWMTADAASRANRVMAAIGVGLFGLGFWLFVTGWRRARRAWAQQFTGGTQ